MVLTNTLFKRLLAGYDETLSFDGISGIRVAERLSTLAGIGASTEGGVTRPGFSEEEKRAKRTVKKWMEEAGLKVTEDGAGNVIGRLEGMDRRPAILSGSHVDSVPNGGNFDGPLGVIAALEVAEAWKENNYHPACPYEVIIFSDEEGTRFGTGLTGSQIMAGHITEKDTDKMTTEQGQTFEEVIKEYGTSLSAVREAKRDMEDAALFVEVHIEQGKLLEQNNLPVGIVKGIAGPVRLNLTFEGEAGHAGNTPMNDRRDAVVAASHFIHSIASFPEQFSDTAVATVGKLQVFPNGANVIAQRVELVVDVRDIHVDKRSALTEAIIDEAKAAGASRDVEVSWQQTMNVAPLLIEPRYVNDMKEAVQAFSIEPMELMSGAGHDSMVMGREVPAAMLFVRSKEGISHNPEEWTELNDCITAVHVLKHFIEKQMHS